MDFRILGPLEVRDRGRQIVLRRQKQKALLAFLVLRCGRFVSTDALLDGLWGERPPRTARAALRNYVSQLRALLGADVLVSQPGGYMLEIDSEQVDAARFERLVEEARHETGRDRADKLREALALWRGPPLAEVQFESFAVDECRRLEERRAAALEELLDAELALGSGAELVAELRALIAENPFRERLRGQLMLALYQAGRQVEALAVYRETRLTLLDELGIAPGQPLRELEQAILRHDPALTPAGARELAPPREEQRKPVTVLFADLAYPDELDPEVLRETGLRVLSRVRGVLEEHGAAVEQRSGDEVMAVFGVPRAHEDDALRAARAAVELQRAAARDADASELEGRGRTSTRVAIVTGEVLAGSDEAGHGFIAGSAVTGAKHLLQTAACGEILASAETIELLGEAVVAEPVGERRPTPARIRDVLEGVPALRRHLEAPLADREAELATLRAALASVGEARTCELLLVLGEPGIGKTRLVRELASGVGRAATVLTGHCVPYGRGAAYLPLVELVRQARDAIDAGDLAADAEQPRRVGAILSALPADNGPPLSRSDLFWAVRQLLEALAAERPVVLVLEDLHWGEPTLLDLVDYLATTSTDVPLLVLGLARPELLETRPEWQAGPALSLGPLADDAVEVLAQNLGSVEDELRAGIVRAGGGNPLFVEQLVANVTEGGNPEAVPGSLAALLASRLDRLEPDELSLLQRAAVAGQEFARSAVLRLLPEEQVAGLDRNLLSLVRRGLVAEAPGGGLRFHHVLVRDAAYTTLPKARRAELHEGFARWLEMQPDAADEVVGFHLERAHAYLAEVAGRVAAQGLAAEAGERLGAAGLRTWKAADTTSTVDLLRRATQLLPQSSDSRLELLCELGLALRTAGEIEEANAVLREAAELAAAAGERRIELRARVELANSHLSVHPEGVAKGLLELARESIPTFDALGDDRAVGRAWLLSGYVAGGLQCRNAEWLQAAERALVHYRRSGWPSGTCSGEIATALYYGALPVEEAVRRCHALLAETPERVAAAHVRVWLGGLEAFAGRVAKGRRLVIGARAVYEEFGYRMALLCGCCAVLAEIELLAGRPAAAEAALKLSCQGLAALRERACLASRAAELADVVYCRGDYDEAERWYRVAEAHTASDDVGARLLVRTVGAKLLARRAAFADAYRLADEAVQLADKTDALNNRAKVFLDRAEILRLEERADEAEPWVRRALEEFERKGNVPAVEATRALLAAC